MDTVSHYNCVLSMYTMNVYNNSVAALYSTTLEKSAVEFATDYINQQLEGIDPSYWLTTLDVSMIAGNETTRRNAGI